MLHPASKGLKSHAALVCAVILITMLNAYVRTVTIISSLVIKLRIIHGILLHKLVEEPGESKKEETFAMPRHRKYNDRYNGSPLTFYNAE